MGRDRDLVKKGPGEPGKFALSSVPAKIDQKTASAAESLFLFDSALALSPDLSAHSSIIHCLSGRIEEAVSKKKSPSQTSRNKQKHVLSAPRRRPRLQLPVRPLHFTSISGPIAPLWPHSDCLRNHLLLFK